MTTKLTQSADTPAVCELCNRTVPLSDLQIRAVPEYQAVMRICGACRATKVHWNPNDLMPTGDTDV